jgi:hypothetical protein
MIRDVGAQDPELHNSPVAWELDEDTDALREELPGAPVCYFNDEIFDNGALVKSGAVRLRCDHGIWVPAENAEP